MVWAEFQWRCGIIWDYRCHLWRTSVCKVISSPCAAEAEEERIDALDDIGEILFRPQSIVDTIARQPSVQNVEVIAIYALFI